MGVVGFEEQIERVDAARARLARAQDELAGIRAQAGALARETAWQSTAAMAFRLSVDEWAAALVVLERRVDGLVDELHRTRSMLVTLTKAAG